MSEDSPPPNKDPHCIAIIDDDPSVRRSLVRLLDAEGFSTTSFSSACAFLDGIEKQRVECIILDVRMPGMDGLELQRILQDQAPGAGIIFVTGHGDVPMCADAMKNGAVDFLLKPFSRESLLSAIGRALKVASERKLEIRTRKEYQAARDTARSLIARLTPRELEVFRGIIAGRLNKQIADTLGTAEKTVKIQRGSLTTKLGVTSVADMVRLAQSAGVKPQ